MTCKFKFLGLLLSAATGAGLIATADAHQLTSGDLEQCSVYDEDGEFSGYDSVCMAEKQAALRDLDRRNDYDRRHRGGWGGRHGDHYYDPNYVASNPYACPSWANNGIGYSSTFYTDGPPVNYIGIFDAPINGTPCHPNPVIYVEGF